MSAKFKVIIPYNHRVEVDSSLPEWGYLKQSVDFIEYKISTSEDFKSFLRNSSCDCLWITEDLFRHLGNPIQFYDDFPTTLKLIAVPWVGTDFLDGTKLRKERNITICNIGPNAAGNVGELALHLTISCFRMTSFFEHCFRFVHRGVPGSCLDYIGSGKQSLTHDPSLSNGHKNSFPEKVKKEQAQLVDLSKHFTVNGKPVASANGKTALILGFGFIGQAIGKKLHFALDMAIEYHKRSGPVPREILGFEAKFHERLDSSTTWASADVIILALPGHESTNNIINGKTLFKCKDGVRIVNVGRGSCVDENALLDALDSGKVAGAGLDVFKNEETRVDDRFFDRWDVTLLPHIGSCVADMVARQTLVTLQNIEDVLLKKGPGLYPVN